MDEILKYINSIEQKIISYRRDFHKYPELGWTEFRTASIIAKNLTDLGYEVQYGREIILDADRMGLPTYEELEQNYNRAMNQGAEKEFMEPIKDGFTGVMGTLKLGEGPIIAMRFDIDALAIEESHTEDHAPYRLKFCSTNPGIMHSCGHDGHAAIGLGVADTIVHFKSLFGNIGTIKLVFQPAEEGVRGAKSMVNAGILDDVDFILANHIMAGENIGTLICGANGFMATTKMDVYFKGQSAHAGIAPNEGKNAMLAACSAVLNLNSIPRHKDGASRINVGTLMSSSDRNVIPEEAYLKMETRGQSSAVNEYIKNYAERIIENTAKMHDLDYKIDYMGEAIVGCSSKELANRLMKVGTSLDIFNNIIEVAEEANISEDYTYMMEKVQNNGGQGVFFELGAAPKENHGKGHHTPDFDIDEAVLSNSVKLFTLLSLDIIDSYRKEALN
jgi:aminobenzoyl-glutamate utilization protein A